VGLREAWGILEGGPDCNKKHGNIWVSMGCKGSLALALGRGGDGLATASVVDIGKDHHQRAW
jgi:hypothetical protein